MGIYLIDFTETAIKDLQHHRKVGNKATMRKIDAIVEELRIHPKSGIGKPEQLKGNLRGFWSRRINHTDRIIYKIEDEQVIVIVISALGHYGDK